MKKILPLDIVSLVLIFGLAIFITKKTFSQSGSRIVAVADKTHYEYSATKNGIYSIQGSIGATTFEAKNGKIRIIDSPCPEKKCVAQGWSSPLICLPNNVIITLENDKAAAQNGEFDAVSQ